MKAIILGIVVLVFAGQQMALITVVTYLAVDHAFAEYEAKKKEGIR